jgi:DNA-3-methyladenine glycosylase I
MIMMGLNRCSWFDEDNLMRDFHDQEWGEPVTDTDILFEYLTLHTFQVGMSFRMVLGKREHFREELAGFIPERLARFGPEQTDQLVENPRLIRNRRKIEAAINNARAWLRLRDELGGDEQMLQFFYSFVNGTPINNQRPAQQPPALHTPEAEALSRALKERGFALTGPATCYGLMQTAGLVNDHAVTCFRH